MAGPGCRRWWRWVTLHGRMRTSIPPAACYNQTPACKRSLPCVESIRSPPHSLHPSQPLPWACGPHPVQVLLKTHVSKIHFLVLQALQRVGERHGGVPASAVAIAWTLSQPGVAAAVVGARNATHLRSLALATTLNLSEDDYLELDAAAEGASKPAQGDVFQWERGGEW